MVEIFSQQFFQIREIALAILLIKHDIRRKIDIEDSLFVENQTPELGGVGDKRHRSELHRAQLELLNEDLDLVYLCRPAGNIMSLSMPLSPGGIRKEE